MALDASTGRTDSLSERVAFLFRRPGEHGEHDVGRRPVEIEAVGNRDDLNAGVPELLDDRERRADARTAQPIDPEDVQPAELAASRSGYELVKRRAFERAP